jgi:hypothetical protein
MKKLILSLSIIFTIGLFYGSSFAVDGQRNAPSVYVTGLEINDLPIPIDPINFYWFSAYGDFTNWIPFQEDKVAFANGEAFISIGTPTGSEQSYFVMHPSGYVFTTSDNFKARLSFRNYSSSIEEGSYGDGFGFYLYSWSQQKVVGIQLDPDGKAYSTWTMGNLLSSGIYATPDNFGTFIIEKIGNSVNLYIEGKKGPVRIKTYENEISGNDIVIGINLWAKDAEDPIIIVDYNDDPEDGLTDNELEPPGPVPVDTDRDGVDDATDPDDDNDGIADVTDPDDDDDGIDDVSSTPTPAPDGDITDPGDDDAQGTADQCPSTPLGEIVGNDGCSVEQTCPEDGPKDGIEEEWKNHGSYVRCIAQGANDLVEDGIMLEQEKGDIVSEAAQSDVGKKIEIIKPEDECKNGGWQDMVRSDGSSFKNQGDCIQYVNTGQ